MEAVVRIFLTGGSGFVGGHLIRRLRAEGHEVVALARSTASRAAVERLGAGAARGELGAVSAELLRGCEVVVHAAARAEDWGTREAFWQANVVGTAQLLQAARQAGVARFLHVGTEAALFDGGPLVHINETQPYTTSTSLLYPWSKAEAERRVLAANGPGFTTMSLRPRLVWGPGDTSVLGAVKEMAAAGQFVWLDGGRFATSTTYVGNFAEAVVRALTAGRGGEAYFVVDAETHVQRDFFDRYAAAAGFELGDRSMPGWLARAAAGVVEAVWGWIGGDRRPPLTRFAVSMMSREVTIRSNKARDELGYVPVVGLEEGLAQVRASAG